MKRNISFWISAFFITFVTIFIVSYAVYRSKNFIEGPVITITSPTNGATVGPDSVTIEGVIKNATAITLNGGKIFLDENGNFKQKILVAPGYTIITLQAEDRYKRATKKTLELFVK